MCDTAARCLWEYCTVFDTGLVGWGPVGVYWDLRGSVALGFGVWCLWWEAL